MGHMVGDLKAARFGINGAFVKTNIHFPSTKAKFRPLEAADELPFGKK